MSGYKIEIRPAVSTVSRRPMVEIIVFGLYDNDPRGYGYMFYSVRRAQRYARKLGKEIGFWVHDYTQMKDDKPSYY